MKTHIILVSVIVSVSTLLTMNYSYADAVFDPNTQPITQIAPYALKQTNLEEGATKAYRPWLETGNWQGDVIEYNVSQSGVLSTDVTAMDTYPPIANGSNWSARATMSAKELNNKDYWQKERKIITSITGSDQIAFQWKTITKTQQSEIYPDNKVGEKVLNFIRGDRKEDGGAFRQRSSILGDISSSTLAYVAAPSTGYSVSDYIDFANTPRAGRIYVGANDGMIHAFDAKDGAEVFAYIPSMLFSRLGELPNMDYKHKGYITSELVAADAQIGSTWKTVLAAGLGAGAKGLFALDVTNPDLTKETSNTGPDKKILWEKNGNDDSNLGHIYGQSSIVMLSDEKWYIVNGNGYGSSSGDARLYLVEVGTGNVKTISTLSSSGNGLSAPSLVDINYDAIADFAYAGDIKGNLWKFDLTNLSNPATLLFKGGSKKPITVQPEIARHPLGGYLIYFGTGSVLSAADQENTDQQSIYAIWDKNSLISDNCGNSTGDLLCQTLSDSTNVGTASVRSVSKYAVDWQNHRGWKVDLSLSGERLLGHPQLRDGRLQFTTHNPTNGINKSWLMELDYLTGGGSEKLLFDLNADGSLGDGDKAGGDIPDALYLGTGYFSQPTIARIKNGSDTLFINGLLTGVVEGDNEQIICTGDCAEGVVGGHFDLDVDTELGGSTDAHTHEYDDKYNVTYGDYFTLQNGATNITDIGIDPANRKFLVFIANADLSIGGNVTIGKKTWNVVEYQKMIQKQLMSWDGVLDLVDYDYDPLAFTLDSIKPSGRGHKDETLRISFDNAAILTGGLIPTQTGCVKSDPNITKGHWRNGALTLHVVDYELVKQDVLNNTVMSNRVYSLQSVSDLPDSITIQDVPISLKEDTNFDGILDTEYGGIIANPDNSAGFLYESTLFWHYKGDCYGEESWEEHKNAAAIKEQQLTDFFAKEASLIADIRDYSCRDFDVGKNVCKDSEFQDLVKRLTISADSFFGDIASQTFNMGETIANLVTSTTDFTIKKIDIPMEDKSLSISETPGPSFRFGRQSWVDF